MNKRKPVRTLCLVFVLITAVLVAAKSMLEKRGVDFEVALGANVLMFLVSLVTFMVSERSLRSANPQAFIRAMYGSFIIKFFIVAIAAFIYIQVTKKAVNKPALLLAMIFYIIYSTIETRGLVKMLRKNKHA